MSKTYTHSRKGRLLLIWHYAKLYGWRRALVKAAGRTGQYSIRKFVLKNKKQSKNQSISILGCGQFAFSTLCYFLNHSKAPGFLHAFDTNPSQAERLTNFYGFKKVLNSVEAVLGDSNLSTIFIASNHASHTPYATAALEKGIDVYVEKPIAVSFSQLVNLKQAAAASKASLYAGYNRPFSPAVQELADILRNTQQPLTLSCYVHGHQLDDEHWYRNAEEGTRICGNAGHWIDLAIHIFTLVHNGIPLHYEATYLPADPSEPDDNFSLQFTTSTKDLFQLTMSSRIEPYGGIREHLELQSGSISASIDDFQLMQYSVGNKKVKRQYKHKDPGHRNCVMQPWLPIAKQRNMEEVFTSTALMLHFAAMAKEGCRHRMIDLPKAQHT